MHLQVSLCLLQPAQNMSAQTHLGLCLLQPLQLARTYPLPHSLQKRFMFWCWQQPLPPHPRQSYTVDDGVQPSFRHPHNSLPEESRCKAHGPIERCERGSDAKRAGGQSQSHLHHRLRRRWGDVPWQLRVRERLHAQEPASVPKSETLCGSDAARRYVHATTGASSRLRNRLSDGSAAERSPSAMAA